MIAETEHAAGGQRLGARFLIALEHDREAREVLGVQEPRGVRAQAQLHERGPSAMTSLSAIARLQYPDCARSERVCGERIGMECGGAPVPR
jgi:hypothetical protein